MPDTERGGARGDSAADQELLRLLLDSSGEGIYGTDLDGNCTFANPACLKLLGFPPETDLLGRHMHDLVHHTRPNGDPYPVEECRIYRAFRERQGVHVDDEVMWCADESSFLAEYWSYPVVREGELEGCVVTFVDITERREVEDELRRTEELLRLLLDSSGEGIYGTDMDGNCTFANPACLKLLGFPPETDLVGKHMHTLVHHTRANGEPYPVEECRIYRAFREGQGVHVDDEVMWCADGVSFPAEYWSYPAVREGELVGSVVTFVDVSERKRTEEELRQAEKLAALGKLSAGLAHELNNPAAAAQRAAAQLLECLDSLEQHSLRLGTHGLRDDQWDKLRTARTQLVEGMSAVNDLDALERADREDAITAWLEERGVDDAWQLAPTLVPLKIDALAELTGALPAVAVADALRWIGQSADIHELVETVAVSSSNISELIAAVKSYSFMDRAPEQEVDVHEGLESTLRILAHRFKSGTTLAREYDRALPPVFVPAGELNQVWTNLIDNAIDAAGPAGTVRVRTRRDGEELIVEVQDDGSGVPEAAQARIFDPFYTTKDVGEGTGLGLDVARRIVHERCHGAIGFESRPGDTTFWVRLPLVGTVGTR